MIITSALLAIGLIFVYSSSAVFALERFGTPFYFVKKQLTGLFLGLLGLMVIQSLSLEAIKNSTPFLFVASLTLTALTLFAPFSHTIHGSSRWLSLAGFSFQPSELLKVSFILYLAYCASRKEEKYSFLRDYLPIFSIIFLPAIIVLKQPDFGLTITLSLTAVIMLFLSQFHTKHLLGTLFSILPIATLLIVIKPYRLRRILVFLNPWHDPHGAGFQIIQSLIAIGSGGFWGMGIAHSKQKFHYLPMQHTDFIFAIIAEETGFIGSFILISLFTLFLYYGFKIAQSLPDQFSKLAVYGFVAIINLQAILNIAVASGLLPTKGLGLPFISYGNSALVCNILMVSFILRLSKQEGRL